ncbi:MAG TPA: peptidoglycan DD-metalloendopeptidase family protein [bacterium]|nr:peptidoglycan DD-metalloendopeptidase family protein [bacterium]
MTISDEFDPPSCKNALPEDHSGQNNQILETVGSNSTPAELVGLFYSKIKAFIFTNKYIPHFIAVFLVVVGLTANLSDKVKAFYLDQTLNYIEPDVENSIISSVGEYTSLIENDGEIFDKAKLAEAYTEGFIDTISTPDTQITDRTPPKPKQPELPDNTKSTVQYVVKSGDTLTSLGWQFGVKLSTLKFVNDLDNINSIKPGTKLKIPPKGYEVSAAQIAKKESEKKAKLASASRNTVTRSSATSKRTYAGEYQNNGGISLIVPISHNGISRGLGKGHTGIDYRAGIGTPVKAAADGVVIQTSTGWSGGYGNEIVVSHGNGVATRYAHLNNILVSPGDNVSQGEVIGKSGNTGRSTGPHLHFEEIVNGRFVNPF